MACGSGSTLFGIPPWHVNLPKDPDTCAVSINSLNAIWDIALGILEILLRVSGYVALGFIITGAIMMIASQGNPERIAQARSTVVNAVIGLVIAISATAIVTTLAGRL